jgi:hypothetical protein
MADSNDVVTVLPHNNNPLVYRLRDIEYYAKNRRIGQYVNISPWSVYTIMKKKDDDTPFVSSVNIPKNAIIVISKDHLRKFGMAYRIRVNKATLNNIYIPIQGNKFKQANDVLTVTDSIVRVGDELDFGETFDTNPMNLNGNGLYVHPSQNELLKALKFNPL